MTSHDTKHSKHEMDTLFDLDSILSSLIDNDVIMLNLKDITLTELLEKVLSGDFNQTVKLLLLLLSISQIKNELKVINIEAMMDKLLSSQAIKIDYVRDTLQEQIDVFNSKFHIKENEKHILMKVIQGVPLKCFKDETGISGSSANKKIRRLWKRLGLENREQLIFVAGWMRLISPELECLQCEEPP
jgi:DNA-binding CsgD family transcriptional regulator